MKPCDETPKEALLRRISELSSTIKADPELAGEIDAGRLALCINDGDVLTKNAMLAIMEEQIDAATQGTDDTIPPGEAVRLKKSLRDAVG